MNLNELKSLLIDRLEDVVQYLMPNGTRHGNYWKVGDVHGNPGQSLSICLAGGRKGLWLEGNGAEGGDIVELWCLNRGITNREARKEIMSFCGVRPNEYLAPTKKYDKPKEDFKPIKRSDEVTQYLVGERRIDINVLSKSMIAQRSFGKPAMAFKYVLDGEVQMVKYINLQRDEKGKKIVSCSSNSRPILFGMESELVRKSKGILVICEGELDCFSWLSCGVPAVSVPFGAKGEKETGGSPNDEWIANCFQWLEDFKTIYIAMDMDEEGQEAAGAIAKRLGRDRCLMVEMPFNDANECLQNDVDLKSLLKEAKMKDPDDIKVASSMTDRIWNEIQKGEPGKRGDSMFDWEDFELRFREFESTGWVGYNGSGKTTCVRQLMAYFAGVRKMPVFVGSYEEKADRYIALMLQQVAKKFIDPSNFEEYKRFSKNILDLVIVHDVEGTASYKDFFQNAKYAARRYGVKHAVFDNISMSDVDVEDKAQCDKFMKAAQDFWKSTGVHLHIILHPRKGMDEKKPPGKMDVKGSGTFTDLLWNGVTIHRDPETGETNLITWKQRATGKHPSTRLYFQEKSGRLARKPIDYDEPYICDEIPEGKTVEDDEPNPF